MTAPDPKPDPRAQLDTWIEHFRGPLVGMLASWGTDWRSAEELAQDTFAEAWVGRARFAGDLHDLDAVGAWIRGIAFNLHRSGQRKQERHAALSIEEREFDQAHVEPEPEHDDRQDDLAAGFAKLSAAHQNILRMFYLEATNAREVAALLGITPKAVDSRLYQARKSLRLIMAKLHKARSQSPANAQTPEVAR